MLLRCIQLSGMRQTLSMPIPVQGGMRVQLYLQGTVSLQVVAVVGRASGRERAVYSFSQAKSTGSQREAHPTTLQPYACALVS